MMRKLIAVVSFFHAVVFLSCCCLSVMLLSFCHAAAAAAAAAAAVSALSCSRTDLLTLPVRRQGLQVLRRRQLGRAVGQLQQLHPGEAFML